MARRMQKNAKGREEVIMLEQLVVRSPLPPYRRLWHAAAVSSCMLLITETSDYLIVENDQGSGAAGIEPMTNGFGAG